LIQSLQASKLRRMSFDSLTFLIFFGLLLALDRALVGTPRKWLLLAASWLFYAGWNPYFLPMLIATASLDWWLARRMQASDHKGRWLALSLISNLGVLSYFKYRFFIAENIDAILGTALLQQLQAPGMHQWALPVGISFYTFQSLSYCIDAYRGQLPEMTSSQVAQGTIDKQASWLDFSLYVAFFPQLVAGPIVRFTDFYPQLVSQKRAHAEAIGSGVLLIMIGLMLKMVLADSVFATVADPIFASTDINAALAWTAMLAFSGQIFCDFAGYSLCAIGAARAFGFWLPDNFNAPYAALGFSDFWRRWHISLSTWLRDYLYIPLGGNRHGVLRTYIALSLTMLIGGLWHGAAWTFVMWGALHGGYLVLERLCKPWLASFPNAIWLRAIGYCLTLLAIMVAWIFFRAKDFDSAWQMLAVLPAIQLSFWAALTPAAKLSCVCFVALVGMHHVERRYSLLQKLQTLPAWCMVLLITLLVHTIVLSPGTSKAFIYFQF
jgi:alginate O-acetyltransferase complex protein AlgI